MSSIKEIKLAQKIAIEQQQVVLELNTLVADIERCEKTILGLKSELETVNRKHQNRQTTRDDIAYLEDLLRCAKKKLAWEKHIASLQKRTPALLERISGFMMDPKIPPADEVRVQMVNALQSVQAAMERLQNVKVN